MIYLLRTNQWEIYQFGTMVQTRIHFNIGNLDYIHLYLHLTYFWLG